MLILITIFNTKLGGMEGWEEYSQFLDYVRDECL